SVNCHNMFESAFFFSSRRRHTRFDCDWSSDVCSSDLIEDGLTLQSDDKLRVDQRTDQVRGRLDAVLIASRVAPLTRHIGFLPTRSEERRVGKECRTRWAPARE